MRIVTWNVNSFTTGQANLKLGLLREFDPDVALLQEVNQETYAVLAGGDLGEGALALKLVDRPRTDGQHHGCAILTRIGLLVSTPQLLAGHGTDYLVGESDDATPFAERALLAEIEADGHRTTVCSFHAPHGGGRNNPDKPMHVARKIAAYQALNDHLVGSTSAIVGMDGNVWDDPWELEVADPTNEQFEVNRFHLDDANHGLRDAWRVWLDEHPDERNRGRRLRPEGQLAVTYQRGSKNHPMVNRMDRIYASPAFQVTAMGHEYADALAAGSDHALVWADLEWSRSGDGAQS